jgi:hypothetical protein
MRMKNEIDFIWNRNYHKIKNLLEKKTKFYLEFYFSYQSKSNERDSHLLK